MFKLLYKQNPVLLLLGLNTLGSLIWILGFHSLRLVLLSGSGLILLFIFFYQRNTLSTAFVKLLTASMFIIGLQSFDGGYYPRVIVDVCSLGVIFSAYSLKSIRWGQTSKLGIFLVVVPVIYYIFTLPMLDLSLLTSGSYDRDTAFKSIEDATLAHGVSKAYVIYTTQQMMMSYLNIFLLLLPLYFQKFRPFVLKLIIIAVFIIILLISAYYQKRQPLIELMSIIILSGIFYRKSLRKIIPRSILIVFLMIFFLFLITYNLSLLDNTINRFKETSANIESFDRIQESVFALSQFSIAEWLFGKGLGSFIPETAGYTMLHIGYANLILKGGIILLFFYLLNTIKNIIYCWKQVKTSPVFYTGVVISIFSMIQLTFAGGFHFYATAIVTGLAMYSRYPLKSFVINQNNENLRRTKQVENNSLLKSAQIQEILSKQNQIIMK